MIIEKFDGLNFDVKLSPLELKLMACTLGQPHDWAHIEVHMKEDGYVHSAFAIRTIVQGMFWAIVDVAAGIRRKLSVAEDPTPSETKTDTEEPKDDLPEMPEGLEAFPKTDKKNLN